MKFLGYVFDDSRETVQPTTLDKTSLVQFIKEHLEVKQLIITDTSNQQLLLMRDGVDLFNQLDEFGIHLPDIYREVRESLVGDGKRSEEKPEWERLYDSIGLSAGEIRMRQRVKRACLAAKTVSDVVDLIQGTYFSVYFYSEDKEQCWGYFDESNFTAMSLLKDENGYWYDSGDPVVIPGDARVVHLRSAEDIHEFILLDPLGQTEDTPDKD
jgi:hypothetical protein